jgi:hypothetical protein
MPIRRPAQSLCPCVLFVCLWGWGLSANAQGFDYRSEPNYWGGSDEDTILIENETDMKILYSGVIKSVCKNLIGFDIDKYFSGGKNKRTTVISNLDDLTERSHYYLSLNEEELTFKFTLNL